MQDQTMDVTKPYEFIRFGAMDVTKPYRFMGFGAMELRLQVSFCPVVFATVGLRPAEKWLTHQGRRSVTTSWQSY